MIANLVGPRHKVQLTKPDKIIVVEIFQVRMFSGSITSRKIPAQSFIYQPANQY